MDKNYKTIVNNFLVEAKEDYIGLWQLINEAERTNPNASENVIQKCTLELVGELLESGMEVVDLVQGGGCISWPDQTLPAVIQCITNEWNKLQNRTEAGFICWFNLP